MGCSLVVLLFCLAVPSFAAEFPPVTPEELKMTEEALAPGAPAIILYREELDDDINQYHHVYCRMKILRDAGRDVADVRVLYNRRALSVGDVSGRTVHADGTIIPFTAKPFDKTVLRAQRIRENITVFTLPDVQVGSVIDYQFDVRPLSFFGRYFIFQPDWILQLNLFQKKAYFKYTPLRDSRLSMLYMIKGGAHVRGVAWSSYLPTSQPQPKSHALPDSNNGLLPSQYIDLQLTDVPPIPKEPYMPPADLLGWQVHFYLATSVTKEDFWRSTGKLWNEEMQEFIGHDSGVRQAVAQMIAPTDTPEQKIRKIYDFISRLENWDAMPERTEQEQKALKVEKTENAADVLQHKGGRHDDLNRLFVSMAREAGVPALVIRVPDRSRHLFDDSFPSLRQFDGDIAIVQLDGKEMFVDPGSRFCPYGYVDWRYGGSRGLRQTEKGAEIADVPLPNYKQSIITRYANLQLANTGTAQGIVTLQFMGLQGMIRRQEGGKTDDAGRRKLLEDEAREMLPANAEIALANQPDWNSPEVPLVAQFKVTMPLAVPAGKRWMVSQHVFEVNENAWFTAAARIQPVYFDHPWEEVDETHITLPEKLAAESLAPESSLHLDYAMYSVQQKQESPSRIFSRREFKMAASGIPATSYDALKSFFDGVRTSDQQPALLKVMEDVAAK